MSSCIAGDEVTARLALNRHFTDPPRSRPITSPPSVPKTIRSLVTAGLLLTGEPASNFQTWRPVLRRTAYILPSSLPKNACPSVALTVPRIGPLVLNVQLILPVRI